MLDFAKKNPMSIGGGVLMGAISIATLILVILIHGKQSKKCKQNKEGLLTAGGAGGAPQSTWGKGLNPFASSPPPPPPSTVSLHDWPPKYFNSKQGGGFTKQYSQFGCWKKKKDNDDTIYVFPNSTDSLVPGPDFKKVSCGSAQELKTKSVKIYKGPSYKRTCPTNLQKQNLCDTVRTQMALVLREPHATTFNWDATAKSDGSLPGQPACVTFNPVTGKNFTILQCRHDSK